MEDKLRMYVNGIFSRALPTKKTVELKEEMIQNLHDKYSDLISEGKTPEAAYNITIAGIGDVSSLLSELESEAVFDDVDMQVFEAGRRKSAMLTSIAVMLYILCAVPLIVLAIFGSGLVTRVGVPLLFIFVAAGTGLLVYNNMTKPIFTKGSNTMVDEFREWQSDTQQRKQLRRSISSALWAIIVALYFIISFSTYAWNITWIIFLLGAVIEAVINIFYTLKK